MTKNVKTRSETSDASVATPMDVTTNVDLVTPKSTGKPLKVPKIKKVIRVSKPKLLKKRITRGLKAMRLEHPPYKEMIDEAIYKLDKRKGVTKAAIKNYISKEYDVGEHQKAVSIFVSITLSRLCNRGGEGLDIFRELRAEHFLDSKKRKISVSKAKRSSQEG